MWSRNLYIAMAGIFLIGGAYIIHGEDIRFRNDAAGCVKDFPSDAAKIDCWLRLIRWEVENKGIARALERFSYLYDTYTLFGAAGCHQHAHKVGDMAYYGIYRKVGDLAAMDFPQSTTGCGYGFFHGFLEHLIQDTPDPAFVTETCEYLRDRLSARMGDIGVICYHGSGHGFTLAQGAAVAQAEWGDIRAFTDTPLRLCEELPAASNREIEDCREGVFNVIADWMSNKEYGFAYDTANPFAPCALIEEKRVFACHYELGQRLSAVIEDDPRKAVSIVRTIQDRTIREMVMGVIVAAIMQRAAPLQEEGRVLSQCSEIGDEALFDVCLRSSLHGIMEHGAPQKEYMQALRYCAHPLIAQRGKDTGCYEGLARRLPRFYDSEQRAAICKKFPDPEVCTRLSS